MINSEDDLFRRLVELRSEATKRVSTVPNCQPIEETGLWNAKDYGGPYVIETTDDFRRAMRGWSYETNYLEWQNAVHTGLWESHYSLVTAMASWKLVQQLAEETLPRKSALFYFRYYCDNSAHRLFTTRERLAQAVNQALTIGLPEGGSSYKAVSFNNVAAKLKGVDSIHDTLAQLNAGSWEALEPYRHAETHHFDPLIRDPYEPDALLRMYGHHSENSGGWTSPHVYDGQPLLEHLVQAYESLVTVCTKLIL